MAEPQVSVKELGDGKAEVSIQMGDIRQLGWAWSKLRVLKPNISLSAEMVKGLCQKAQAYLKSPVEMQVGLGGVDYFRGILKSCFNLLGANAPDIALGPAFDNARQYIAAGAGASEDFFRWTRDPDMLVLPKLGDADHFVGITTVRGGVEDTVQLFGGLRHSIRLADKFQGAPFRFGYLVNPLRDSAPAETRNPTFDERAVAVFTDQAPLPDKSIWPTIEKGLGVTMEAATRLAQDKHIGSIIDEVFGPIDGRPITQEMIDGLDKRIDAYIASRLRKPTDGANS